MRQIVRLEERIGHFELRGPFLAGHLPGARLRRKLVS